ncbi:MAG TPA: hypothetical protein VGA68_01570 [Woeseiaceae bacterium]
MFKILFLVLLIAAVVFLFFLRQTPRRPPRDWRHGSDDEGPVRPAGQIGLDDARKEPAGEINEMVTGETESAEGDASGDD